MRSYRAVERVIEPELLIEGAGVRVQRSIGARALNYLDPFLLLDHFASTDPRDYEAGFPLHPHRGIETVTYILSGEVRHKDTLGNSGSIGTGDVQWMTAGRGIMHEEMPQVRPEGIAGFQLWVNLPAKLKMIAPRYQEIPSARIPRVTTNGASIRVVAGRMGETGGPVTDIAAEPTYLDVEMPAGGSFTGSVPRGHTAFAYVYQGEVKFAGGNGHEAKAISNPQLVVLVDGDILEVSTDQNPARFLLVSARPLHEPIARYGPFVMNTREEIEQTLKELREGTFIR